MAILAEQMELSDDQQIQWNEDGNGKSVFNIFHVSPFSMRNISIFSFFFPNLCYLLALPE